ncbi:MAG: hypothetical protein C0392_11905 [Syntrophus sp. (in: bacteria)]|nr:hypothetical protein [Syntrophus sp. (in: bacteria)]
MLKKLIVTSTDIGEIIKKKRKELNISQERLADILGVSCQQVQRYENGTNKLNVENIQIIAEALSIPVSHFFEVNNKPIPAKNVTQALETLEKNLLSIFRNIRSDQYKKTLIQVAKIVEKASLKTNI